MWVRFLLVLPKKAVQIFQEEYNTHMFNEVIKVKTMNQKQEISVVEFEKKVEIEAANLMYFDYMKREEAFAKAKSFVSEKYQIQTMR